MRHGVRGRKLGRVDAHRKALFRNMLASLFLHERIRTTLTKAKEIRPLAEKLVTLAKREGDAPNRLHARRLATTRLMQAPAVKRLFEVVAPRFKERPGGYTRILKLGKMRKGDNAELAILEFVDYVFESRDKKIDLKKGKKVSQEHDHAKDEGAEAKTPKVKSPKGSAADKGAQTKGDKKTTPKKDSGSKDKPKAKKDTKGKKGN